MRARVAAELGLDPTRPPYIGAPNPAAARRAARAAASAREEDDLDRRSREIRELYEEAVRREVEKLRQRRGR
jgi:hypothetical protein